MSTNQVSVRLRPKEERWMHKLRGELSPAEFFRMLLARAVLEAKGRTGEPPAAMYLSSSRRGRPCGSVRQ